jgi:CheY-like chemotaxis protein
VLSSGSVEASIDEDETGKALTAAGAGGTLLVVDDEATVRMLVSDVLGNLGYVEIKAADRNSSLKVLRSDAKIDLLVTDVALPGGINGSQMADAARQFRPLLKTLFITGYAKNAVVGDGHFEPWMLADQAVCGRCIGCPHSRLTKRGIPDSPLT